MAKSENGTGDELTPRSLRILQEFEERQILEYLKEHRDVLFYVRDEQRAQRAEMGILSSNVEKMVTATVRTATLNEARENREDRKEAREIALVAREQARQDAAADRRWSFISEHWKGLSGGGAIMAAAVGPEAYRQWLSWGL